VINNSAKESNVYDTAYQGRMLLEKNIYTVLLKGFKKYGDHLEDK
jgi:hypothetical protein